MATNFDSAGASLVIAHRDPLPDGYVNLREYLLPTTHACTFTVRTVNGQTHTYLQRPGSHLLQNCLIQSDAAGNYDLRFFSESQLRGSSTIVDVIQCRV